MPENEFDTTPIESNDEKEEVEELDEEPVQDSESQEDDSNDQAEDRKLTPKEKRELRKKEADEKKQAKKQAELDKKNAKKQAALDKKNAKKQAALDKKQAKEDARKAKKQAALDKKLARKGKKPQDDNLDDNNDFATPVEDPDNQDIQDTQDNQDIQDNNNLDDSSDNESNDSIDEKKLSSKERRELKNQQKKQAKKDQADEKKRQQEQKKYDKVHYAYLPKEEDEDSNPLIRTYNEIVRAAMALNVESFEIPPISTAELSRVYTYVSNDYPEIFWLAGYQYSYELSNPDVARGLKLSYRCLLPNGEIDKKQISQKVAELQKASKPFIAGITRKTDPYEAFLTIYRRVILTLDYDGNGLNAQIDKDMSKDDRLRSLHSALVEHKVVCAGYAVALQYLLHLVGINCGYAISENGNSGCHAFNIVKLGKYCYYCDATWGDSSNTIENENSAFYKDHIGYDYCLVPEKEFLLAGEGFVPLHKVRQEYYPKFETLKATSHEYYRYHNSYIVNYNEEELVNIFILAAMNYKESECGKFEVSFRCSDKRLANYVKGELAKHNFEAMIRIVSKAQAKIKDKRVRALLDRKFSGMIVTDANVVYICF